jgi:anthranilate synthase/aminodeoxychorismate synthase-like glutamine amidotransferase
VILLIDNYDSFTWNLVHRIAEGRPGFTERDLLIRRNDEITPDDIETLAPTHIILSPGPCSPREAGNSCDIVRRSAGRTPILGVCLGHQCIADAFGMPVTRSDEPIHGKTSLIAHDGRGLFQGLPNPFQAARYHSLIVREEDIADGWEVAAWLAEEGSGNVVMGLRRVWPDASHAPLEGVQFHPESFMTPEGHKLLSNFLSMHAPTPAGSSGRKGMQP